MYQLCTTLPVSNPGKSFASNFTRTISHRFHTIAFHTIAIFSVIEIWTTHTHLGKCHVSPITNTHQPGTHATPHGQTTSPPPGTRKTFVPMASNNTKIAPKDDAAPEKKNKKTTTKNTKTDKGDIKKRALEMLGKCCVRPKECKTRVLKDINGETGPISKCYKRWEVFENVLSVLSVSLLGASFFFSWVILRTTTFSYGQPMPMHVHAVLE